MPLIWFIKDKKEYMLRNNIAKYTIKGFKPQELNTKNIADIKLSSKYISTHKG